MYYNNTPIKKSRHLLDFAIWLGFDEKKFYVQSHKLKYGSIIQIFLVDDQNRLTLHDNMGGLKDRKVAEDYYYRMVDLYNEFVDGGDPFMSLLLYRQIVNIILNNYPYVNFFELKKRALDRTVKNNESAN